MFLQRCINLLLVALTLPMLGAVERPNALEASGPDREHQVQAAMICNFVQFVDWPEGAFASGDAPLVIAVVGPNPLGDVLEQLTADKRCAGHRICVKYFASPEQIQTCHVLFVPASEDSQLPQIMKRIAHAPVLSVGETDAFPWNGGIVRFFTEDNKVRFEINVKAADAVHLRISSKLLKLARIFDPS